MSEKNLTGFSLPPSQKAEMAFDAGGGGGPWKVEGFPVAMDVEEDQEGFTNSRLKKQLRKKKAKSGGFESLNLSSSIYRGIKRKGYQIPTPIQRKTLPLILAGYDVVAMARTGSGKTAAFLIPMLEKLKAHSPKAGSRGLILSPTRELALQTFKFCKELGRFTDLRVAILVGGDSMEVQFEDLSKFPDILIATPGRLMHHLSEVEGMSLRNVEYIVFDEADRLFEMGFSEQLRQILSQLSETRQTLLFSATLPRLLADFAKAGLRDPRIVRLDVETKISPDLKLLFFTIRQEDKPAALIYLVRDQIHADQQTLIFVSTKHHVEFLQDLLQQEAIELSVVYGSMDQAARKIHLARFRARKTMLLLVTDVAARGIDIPLLDNVINYDFPSKPKLFVHRVGRAARAGRTGTSYSFVTSDEMPYLLDLHLFISTQILPAPSEEEVAAGGEKVLTRVTEALERGDSIYGSLPQPVLDFGGERVRELVNRSTELTALQKSCTNAFRLYLKTRPNPSSESIKRVKRLPLGGLHPVFRDQVEGQDTAAAAFADSLKKFRPKQTVLEAEAEAAKAKNLKTPIAQALEVMKRKRALHEHIIIVAQQKEAATKTIAEEYLDDKEVNPEIHLAKKRKRKRKMRGNIVCKKLPRSYKDEKYYISSVPSNRHTELGLSVKGGEAFTSNRMEAEVLDLLPDEQEGAQKQKAMYHWDKKNKKYIKLHRGEKITASGKIRNESGNKINMGNRGIYQKWQKRTHMHVSTHGEEDNTTTAAQTTGYGKNSDKTFRKGKGRSGRTGRQGTLPNATVRNELREIEEVRKQRQQTVLKQSMKPGKGRRKNKGLSSKKGGRRKK